MAKPFPEGSPNGDRQGAIDEAERSGPPFALVCVQALIPVQKRIVSAGKELAVMEDCAFGFVLETDGIPSLQRFGEWIEGVCVEGRGFLGEGPRAAPLAELSCRDVGALLGESYETAWNDFSQASELGQFDRWEAEALRKIRERAIRMGWAEPGCAASAVAAPRGQTRLIGFRATAQKVADEAWARREAQALAREAGLGKTGRDADGVESEHGAAEPEPSGHRRPARSL